MHRNRHGTFCWHNYNLFFFTLKTFAFHQADFNCSNHKIWLHQSSCDSQTFWACQGRCLFCDYCNQAPIETHVFSCILFIIIYSYRSIRQLVLTMIPRSSSKIIQPNYFGFNLFDRASFVIPIYILIYN